MLAVRVYVEASLSFRLMLEPRTLKSIRHYCFMSDAARRPIATVAVGRIACQKRAVRRTCCYHYTEHALLAYYASAPCLLYINMRRCHHTCLFCRTFACSKDVQPQQHVRVETRESIVTIVGASCLAHGVNRVQQQCRDARHFARSEAVRYVPSATVCPAMRRHTLLAYRRHHIAAALNSRRLYAHRLVVFTIGHHVHCYAYARQCGVTYVIRSFRSLITSFATRARTPARHAVDVVTTCRHVISNDNMPRAMFVDARRGLSFRAETAQETPRCLPRSR